MNTLPARPCTLIPSRRFAMRDLVTLVWFVLMVMLSVGAFVANAIWLIIALPVAIVLLLVFGIFSRIFDRD